ncbi:MAG: hypothetical protein EB020_11425, partial [Proteobacteria bacterium]|nr:hypothetical protein [Pseudomonadota bacterium]
MSAGATRPPHDRCAAGPNVRAPITSMTEAYTSPDARNLEADRDGLDFEEVVDAVGSVLAG